MSIKRAALREHLATVPVTQQIEGMIDLLDVAAEHALALDLGLADFLELCVHAFGESLVPVSLIEKSDRRPLRVLPIFGTAGRPDVRTGPRGAS